MVTDALFRYLWISVTDEVSVTNKLCLSPGQGENRGLQSDLKVDLSPSQGTWWEHKFTIYFSVLSTGRWSALEQIIDEIDHISDIHYCIQINVTSLDGLRGSATFE